MEISKEWVVFIILPPFLVLFLVIGIWFVVIIIIVVRLVIIIIIVIRLVVIIIIIIIWFLFNWLIFRLLFGLSLLVINWVDNRILAEIYIIVANDFFLLELIGDGHWVIMVDKWLVSVLITSVVINERVYWEEFIIGSNSWFNHIFIFRVFVMMSVMSFVMSIMVSAMGLIFFLLILVVFNYNSGGLFISWHFLVNGVWIWVDWLAAVWQEVGFGFFIGLDKDCTWVLHGILSPLSLLSGELILHKRFHEHFLSCGSVLSTGRRRVVGDGLAIGGGLGIRVLVGWVIILDIGSGGFTSISNLRVADLVRISSNIHNLGCFTFITFIGNFSINIFLSWFFVSFVRVSLATLVGVGTWTCAEFFVGAWVMGGVCVGQA